MVSIVEEAVLIQFSIMPLSSAQKLSLLCPKSCLKI